MTKKPLDEFLRSKVRNRDVIRKTSARIDAFRKKYGRPTTGFDSVTLLRKLREGR